jgi:cohesin domain-containing protein
MTPKLLVLSVLAFAAGQAATVSIDPSSLTVGVGSAFDLNVNISSVSDLFAFQFDIVFNPEVLSATSVSEGPFLLSGGTTAFVPGSIDNVGGEISVTADSLVGAVPGVSGDGVLATLHFAALAAGTSDISLSNIILLDSNLVTLDSTSADGSVTIGATTLPEPAPALTMLAGSLAILALFVRRQRKLTQRR